MMKCHSIVTLLIHCAILCAELDWQHNVADTATANSLELECRFVPLHAGRVLPDCLLHLIRYCSRSKPSVLVAVWHHCWYFASHFMMLA